MSILVANDGSRFVDTIAERDAITKRFNGMQVTVRDATADPQFGGGRVQYLWDSVVDVWAPVWSSNKNDLVFSTEEKIISNGRVTADYPIQGTVWSAKVLDADGLILGDAAPSVSGSTVVITEGTAQDGNRLRYTYAHGTMTTEMSELWKSKVDVDSPAFEGIPTAPTPLAGAAPEQIANVAFVSHAVQEVGTGVDLATVNQAIEDSLTDTGLLGIPTAPTAAVGTEDGQVANTEFMANTLKDAGFAYVAEEGWKAPTPVLDQYTLKTAAATSNLDLAEQQVFTVSAATNRTLAFVNAPAAGRAMTVVIKVLGNTGTITWPAGISWNGGTAPTLGANFTVVVLLWDGSTWVGSVGSTD